MASLLPGNVRRDGRTPRNEGIPGPGAMTEVTREGGPIPKCVTRIPSVLSA